MLMTCIGEGWRPRIGDPEVTGWLTVLAYLLCAVLAAAVWRRSGPPRRSRFWGLTAVLMLFLALNKQLDLQTAMTALGRCLAIAQGWYEGRRIVQSAFILSLLALLLAALLGGIRVLRRRGSPDALAVAGLAVLGTFILVRAAGFHHMDALIGVRRLGVSVNYLFENAGLAMVAANALRHLRNG